MDEVKKLCTSLRRNAKEERVLFHYNGHGVPRPTVNGEVWVFNKVGMPSNFPFLPEVMPAVVVGSRSCPSVASVKPSIFTVFHQTQRQ